MPLSSPEAQALPSDKGLLRFLTCGSVDDGKSTLIGRLLLRRPGDPRRPVRGAASRSRGASARPATISTSRCCSTASKTSASSGSRSMSPTVFSATPRRAFIVADTPGHEQYTRNMATGASTADLAILLVDARKGVLDQTRRHSLICSLLGIRHVVLAVNKLDLVGFDRAGLRADRRRLRAALPPALGFAVAEHHPDLGAAGRQHHRAVVREPPWYRRAEPARLSRNRRGRGRRCADRPSAFRCSGSIGRTAISAALPAPWRRAR